METMMKKWVRRGVKIAVMVIIAGAVFGFIVMSLWNWLIPAVFGWHAITFWQALGLVVLSKLLFGGFRGGHGHGGHWRKGMRERWEQMTPEQREELRKGLRGRCGHFGRAMTQAGAMDQPKEEQPS
jgi:hypothetical protein